MVGDGALTGGLAYEALNNIGATGTRVVVIAQRQRAVLRADRLPPVDGRRGCRHTSGWWRPFFEALGLSYQGPVDGHDVAALECALRRVADCTGPVVLHVHTIKGHGYAPAENDDDKCLHDIGPFDPATGIATKKAGAGLSYTHAFTAALMAEAEARPDVVALTAAMPGPTGLAAFRDRYPDRFFDVGIAEQHAVTAAAGMAMGGLRPVVAIYSTFLNRAWDQIYYDVGLHRPAGDLLRRPGRRHRGGRPEPPRAARSGPADQGAGDDGVRTVLLRRGGGDASSGLGHHLGTGGHPLAQDRGSTGRRHRDRHERATDPGRQRRVPPGRGEAGGRVRAGGRPPGRRRRRRHGVGRPGCLPLAPDMISDARRHKVVLTAEDGVVEGGVGALVASALAHGACTETMPQVVACGVPVAYVPHGRPADILSQLGLDGPGLSATALDALERAGRPVSDDVLAKVHPGS